MYSKYFLFLGYIFIAYEVVQVNSKFELTNINCTSLDESFSGFEYCYIKSVNRSYKYISLKVNLHRIPITKIKVNFTILKRLNGYKPFLYNITFDACKYLAAKNRNPVASYIHTTFESFSNMNHSCPYDHDIIVERLSISSINDHITKRLPFPEGDYALFTSWFAYGINRAEVKVYGTLSEF